jgi:uncharacterized RDD family membrane protein YckC
MEESGWYYANGGTREGPVGVSVLRQLIAAGRIVPETLVWRGGMADWAAASALGELAGAWQGTPMGVAGAQGVAAPGQVVAGYPNYPGYAGAGAAGGAYPLSYLSPADARVQYGGFWLRVVAYIIDALITGIGNGLLYGVLMLTLGSLGEPEAMRQAVLNLGQWSGILFAAVYFVAFESSQFQATPGKMALGLKVTDLNGGRISVANAIGRYFAKFLSALILCIGFMMAGWTEKKQALHDILASTLVVKK